MENVDFTWVFIKMLAALVVVCVIAILLLRYGAPYLSKRGGIPFLSLRAPKQSPFELLARFSLEHRRALYLMRIEGKRYVLGASEGGITKLAELDEAGVEGGGTRDEG